MGKNTMMKRCIRLYCERTKDDAWAALLPLLVGNVGVVFTQRDLNDVRAEIEKYKIGAPARVGGIAPCDVTVPAGPTSKLSSLFSLFKLKVKYFVLVSILFHFEKSFCFDFTGLQPLHPACYLWHYAHCVYC